MEPTPGDPPAASLAHLVVPTLPNPHHNHLVKIGKQMSLPVYAALRATLEELESRDAEIERLRSQVSRWEQECCSLVEIRSQFVAELKEACAEIKLLRSWLDDIHSVTFGPADEQLLKEIRQWCEEALDGKPSRRQEHAPVDDKPR